MTSSRGFKAGDSLDRRSMSRTGKDIPSRIHIAIVDATAITAYGVDGVRVQPEFLSTSGGQDIEVKTTRPKLVPFKRVLLGIVAVVPNVVDRAALLVQQTAERLHAIAVDQIHCIIIQDRRLLWSNPGRVAELVIG